jgi:hypothetical protein
MKNSKRNGIVCVFLFMLLGGVTFLLGVDSLIQQVSATRTEDGGIIILGKTKLPKGTKLMIDISRSGSLLGQANVTVNEGGSFSSEPFTNKGKPHKSGLYKVTITSHFTSIWQSNDVLLQVGKNGAKLPPGQLVPDDPEFPKAGGHLEVSFDITFPGMSPEQQALHTVWEAVLTVQGKGRSADAIKDVVAYFVKGGGFKPTGWSAKLSSNGVWIVTLNCIDAGEKKQAQWEYNPNTKAVKYLDPLAKLLSWTPSE